MKRIAFIIATLSLVSTAYVQVRDDFNGGFDSTLRWSWKLPVNNPECTLDPMAVSFSAGGLEIQMRDGGMYSFYNTHRDVPNLILTAPAQSDWYIETRFRIDWAPISIYNYVQAGIVIAQDAGNYFQLLVTRDATNQTSDVNGSTNLEENDNFEWGERVTNPWSPDTDWIGLRIEHVSGEIPEIRLYFSHSATNGWVVFDGFNGGVYPAGSRQYNWILNLVSTPGTRVGLYTDNAGSGHTDTFKFDYFETNLPVALAGDVNADGCVDDADLLAVLFDFGQQGCALETDMNHDGTVDDADLLMVLFAFGRGC